jgi:hypothetical protein
MQIYQVQILQQNSALNSANVEISFDKNERLIDMR